MLPSSKKAFTLIELLIVVAIIAILAAIAVPNFLEAQTRSKVARAVSDIRTVSVAVETYVVDYNNEPKTYFPGYPATPGVFSPWWGFVSKDLTTPVAYMTSWPAMPFNDTTVVGWWKQGGPGHSEDNQPYTMIRDTSVPDWPPNQVWTNPGAPAEVVRSPIPQDFYDNVLRSGYIIYTSGPDNVDGAVWGSPMTYDPSNGTISWGDVYRFGNGSPDDGDTVH